MQYRDYIKSLMICIVIILGFLTSIWASTDTINVGVSLSLTGEFSYMGDMQQKAYRIWEDRINESGGVLGKSVRIIIKDDQSNPEEVFKIYQYYVSDNHIDFIFGPYSSLLTQVVAPIAEKHHHPMLVAGAAADSIWEKGYQYIFGMWTPASQYLVGFLEMCVAYDIDNIAILANYDPFSLKIAEGAHDWALRLGLSIKFYEKFLKGSSDLNSLLTRARTKGAQVVISSGHFNDAVDINRALNVISWKPKVFIATVGPNFDKYYELLKDDAEGVFSISIWEPNPLLNFPNAQDFAKKFFTRYGIKPTYHAATAYAAGELLAQAIEKAGSLDREKVRAILSAMNTYSIIGRYGVNRRGLQVKRFPLCTQWQNGKKEIVWPEELRTAKPIIFIK